MKLCLLPLIHVPSLAHALHHTWLRCYADLMQIVAWLHVQTGTIAAAYLHAMHVMAAAYVSHWLYAQRRCRHIVLCCSIHCNDDVVALRCTYQYPACWFVSDNSSHACLFLLWCAHLASNRNSMYHTAYCLRRQLRCNGFMYN